jgi:RNA polymerase sigma factor (sigma-70 family)
VSDGLRWLAEHEPEVRRLAKRSCRGRYDLVDDLWEEAIDRVPRMVDDLWDGERPVYPYVMANLRMYFWKWMNAQMDRHEMTCPLPDDLAAPQPSVDPDVREQVQAILEQLDPYDAALLSLCKLAGLTFEEIGHTMGVSKGTAWNHYQNALTAARRIANA